MSNQTKNNNLNYLINIIFTKGNILFVLSCKNEDYRTSFSRYYTSSVEVKNLNVLIDGKSFFDTPIKIKKKHTKNFLKQEEIMTIQQVIY